MKNILISFLLIIVFYSQSYAATRTINASVGDWNTTAAWEEAAVPGANDNVVANSTGSSGNLTVSEGTPQCLSLNFTNYSAKFALNNFGQLTVFGNITFSPSMTFTYSGTPAIIFQVDSGTRYITTSGKTIPSLIMNQYSGAPGATIVFVDNKTSTGNIQFFKGVLLVDGASSNSNLTHSALSFNISSGITRTVTMGNSTFNITGTGNAWQASNSTGITFSANTSAINLISTSAATEKKFLGGNLTYNNVSIIGGGKAFVFYGNNSFNTLSISNANTPTINLTAADTQRVTSFNAQGSSTNIITIQSATIGTKANLVKTGGGVVQCNYVNVSDVAATPPNTWYAGTGSTLVNTTGWILGQAPFGALEMAGD